MVITKNKRNIMKKYIYNIFAVLLAATVMTSCAEEEGTNPGGDSAPHVTIFDYEAASPYNPDNDIQLRLAANNQTEAAYYLAELTADKEAYVAANGEAAYSDYVVENGTQVEGISGESTADLTLTGLIGEYTITVVAVKGNTKVASEVEFFGIEWTTIGIGIYHSAMFVDENGDPAVFPIEVRKAGHAEWYQLPSVFEEGMNLVIKMNGTSATVEQQPLFTDPTYGTVYAEGTGSLVDGQIQLALTYTCAAGSFGLQQELLELPTE